MIHKKDRIYINLWSGFEKQENALVEESSGGDAIYGGGVSFQTFASCFEHLLRFVCRQARGSDDGDVRIESWAGELGSQSFH